MRAPGPLGAVVLLLCACGPASSGPPDAGHQPGPELRACARAATGPVETTAQLVERLNALPRPVSVACFLASLPRPLKLVATTSTFSAQPAGGDDDPRLFLLGTGLVLSVVPGGAGARLIESGEWITPTRTLKGEVELPVTAPLPADAPFTRVAQSNFTSTCGLCHRAEAPHDTIPGAYVSAAFRPNPGEEVKLAAVAALHQRCVDSGEASERCTMLHALFDFGQLTQGAFAREVELFIP